MTVQVTVSFRSLEIAVAMALVALGAFATFEATKMPFGTLAMPGPAMMPIALGVLLMLCSAGLILLELRKPAAIAFVPLGNRHVAVAVVAIIVAGLAFERAGFVITATLFLFVLLVALSTAGLVALAARRRRCQHCDRFPVPEAAGRQPAAAALRDIAHALMDAFSSLMQGFAVALQPANLMYCVIGCLWGTMVGVLPGLGPLAGLTLLLPLTYQLEPGVRR